MLAKKDAANRRQISMVCLEDLVPEDHLLRAIEDSIDFSFIYDEVKDLYSEDKGRPSIDPVVLFKIIMIQSLYGIPSMRQTIREINVNVAYRWFLGYGFNEAVPHFSAFSKNYERRFKDTDLFDQIFERVLLEAVNSGFVDPEAIFIDGTHVKANANRNRHRKALVKREVQRYKGQLQQEIAEDRIEHGKKPLKDKDHDDDDGSGCEFREITVSTTDPDSGMFHKGEKERCFAYSANVACDRNNFILAKVTVPGNHNDSTVFDQVYEQVITRFPEVEAVVMDAGYKTPAICKQVIDDHRIPVLPYKRPQTKDGFFKKYEYVYDEYYDCIICPENAVLKYSTTNREGYREYKSDPAVCKDCPNLQQCTLSKNHTKVVTRHLWEDYLEQAEDIRHTFEYKELYKLRSQTIERVFADAKEKHGMRYTTLRGLKRVDHHLTMLFTCMNLKKLALWKRKTRNNPPGCKLTLSAFAFRALIFPKKLNPSPCLAA